MSVIAIPEPLREKLGPEAAQALVELLNRTGQGMRDDVVTLAAERFERRLAEEMTQLTRAMAELETRLAHRMGDQIRWMFAFWVTQIGAVLGILFAFFRS